MSAKGQQRKSWSFTLAVELAIDVKYKYDVTRWGWGSPKPLDRADDPYRIACAVGVLPRPAGERVFLCLHGTKRKDEARGEYLVSVSAVDHDLGRAVRDCCWGGRRQHDRNATYAMDQLHRRVRRDCADLSRRHRHRSA